MIFGRKIFLLLLILLGISFAVAVYWIFSASESPIPIGQDNPIEESPSLSQPATSTVEVPDTPEQNTKTYRNEEWGLELEYPGNWVIRREHKSLTYYSKFFLIMSTPVMNMNNEEKFDETFLINVVLPEFIRGFDGLEKTDSEIVVAGVRGVKYEYVFNNFPETTVILPFGELKMILSTGGGSKQYLDEFNQILASFKFLK